jgi:hypothetical protein
VACWMYDGGVSVNGELVRNSTPDWGARMAPGEIVRVRYVAATRMVSVVRRGRSYDVVALPATADIAHMRFGVALHWGNSMRVTGASAGASCADAGCAALRACAAMFMPFAFISAHFHEPHVRFVVRTRVMCQAGRARAAGARGDIVAWLCERAPLWVVVHVYALGLLECCRARLICGSNFGQICDQGSGLFASAAAAVAASRAHAHATTAATLSVELRHNCWPIRRDTE